MINDYIQSMICVANYVANRPGSSVSKPENVATRVVNECSKTNFFRYLTKNSHFKLDTDVYSDEFHDLCQTSFTRLLKILKNKKYSKFVIAFNDNDIIDAIKKYFPKYDKSLENCVIIIESKNDIVDSIKHNRLSIIRD